MEQVLPPSSWLPVTQHFDDIGQFGIVDRACGVAVPRRRRGVPRDAPVADQIRASGKSFSARRTRNLKSFSSIPPTVEIMIVSARDVPVRALAPASAIKPDACSMAMQSILVVRLTIAATNFAAIKSIGPRAGITITTRTADFGRGVSGCSDGFALEKESRNSVVTLWTVSPSAATCSGPMR